MAVWITFNNDNINSDHTKQVYLVEYTYCDHSLRKHSVDVNIRLLSTFG
jgi:hypothetical protein